MITRKQIEDNLKILDRKYKKATSQKETLFYSKLAILELSGWIEESMDDIILRCARRHLKDEKNIKYVEKEIVKRTHGFDYPNFRQMLVKLLGLINVEKIEKKVKRKLPVSLEDLLGPLKKARDSEAHTHINKGVTRHINAPSVTFGQFPGIYKGLVEFDSVIIKTKF